MAFRRFNNSLSSTSKEAKRLIRHEIEYYLRSANPYLTDLTVFDMKRSVGGDSSSTKRTYKEHRQLASDYCEYGGFAISRHDEECLLEQIYGKRVSSWSYDKVHSTYKNLIAREYATLATYSKDHRQIRFATPREFAKRKK